MQYGNYQAMCTALPLSGAMIRNLDDSMLYHMQSSTDAIRSASCSRIERIILESGAIIQSQAPGPILNVIWRRFRRQADTLCIPTKFN